MPASGTERRAGDAGSGGQAGPGRVRARPERSEVNPPCSSEYRSCFFFSPHRVKSYLWVWVPLGVPGVVWSLLATFKIILKSTEEVKGVACAALCPAEPGVKPGLGLCPGSRTRALCAVTASSSQVKEIV